MIRRKIEYDPRNDYYKRLGVAPEAPQDEVQQAYRRKAKKLHPDVNPERRDWATDQFQLLNEAYDILGNPELRQMYDARRQVKTGQKNWWDVPHAPQPGYSGIHTPSPRYRKAPVRGAWLSQIGLGFMRPFYVPLADLVFSPYRYVLGILTLVLMGNLFFIVFGIARDKEKPTSASVLPTTQVIQGQIPTNFPPTVTPMVVQEILSITPSCAVDLRVNRVEQLLQSVKLTAWVDQEGLRSSNVRIARVEILDSDSARRLEDWRDADLIVQPDPDMTTAPLGDLSIPASALPSGAYVVVWSPILSDGTTPGTCYEMITLTSD